MPTTVTELEKAYQEYLEKYIDSKQKEIQLNTIKDNLKYRYSSNKIDGSEAMKKNNIVVKEVMRKEYEVKNEEELYDFLEDRGLLPLAVNISRGLEKHFNLDSAKVNVREYVRPYPGKNEPINKADLSEHFQGLYENDDIDELSTEFNKHYTNAKLADSELEIAKEKMLKAMKDDSVHSLKTPDLGTVKIQLSYEYDPYILYDALSGKKELYLKDIGNFYEVIILPDEKTATLPKNFKINNMELSEYKKEVELKSSNFTTKTNFNKFIKDGYIGYKFEIPVDPSDFFRSLPISRTKLTSLVENGYITDEELESFYNVIEDEDNISIQILTEGAAEMQKNIFLDKLAAKAQRLRERDEDFTPVSDFNESLVDVGFDDFSF